MPMTELDAHFDVAKEQLLAYLYKVASMLNQVEQVKLSQSALDFVAQIPSPDLKLEELSDTQKAVLVAFMAEFFPQAILGNYDLD